MVRKNKLLETRKSSGDDDELGRLGSLMRNRTGSFIGNSIQLYYSVLVSVVWEEGRIERGGCRESRGNERGKEKVVRSTGRRKGREKMSQGNRVRGGG